MVDRWEDDGGPVRPDWEDTTAKPNGIGPVCKHCGHLIDSPDMHKTTCPIYAVKPVPAEPIGPVRTIRMMMQVDIPILNSWDELGMTDSIITRIPRIIQEQLSWYKGTVTELGHWERGHIE